MSHAYSAVKFPDNSIFHFEYNGTVDMCYPRLRDSINEVEKFWRDVDNSDFDNAHNCPHQKEVIEIATTYGGGFSWNGLGCKICKIITDNLYPQYDNNYSNGLPDWYPKYEE